MAICLRVRIASSILLAGSSWGLVACGGGGAPAGDGATLSPATTATAAPTPAATPTGGPAPAELLGTWNRVALEDFGSPTKAKMSVILTADRFQVQDAAGGAGGSIVVNGGEIDFFSAARCGLYLPDGVGRYQWRLHGGTLHFTPLNTDPCSTRTFHFANQDFIRIGP